MAKLFSDVDQETSRQSESPSEIFSTCSTSMGRSRRSLSSKHTASSSLRMPTHAVRLCKRNREVSSEAGRYVSIFFSLCISEGALIDVSLDLEISKPQRNSRSGQASAEPSRTSNQRRSRSPEYGRGGPGGARSNRPPPFSDFRDEPGSRRRDDYRPPRSPSPRGPRGRDGYRSRDRTPERYDRRDRRRSRSPYGRDRRYRSPSPRGRGYDAEPDHFSRRGRDPPKVQIIAADDVDR